MTATSMTLIDYIFMSMCVALLIGFIVMALEYRQLWRDHRRLQNRCWGLQREIFDEDEDEDKEGDTDDKEETYH